MTYDFGELDEVSLAYAQIVLPLGVELMPVPQLVSLPELLV
jgi:hypothetical protein